MLILAGLAMIAQQAHLLRQRLVVRRNRSGFSTGAQILPWVEAESGRMAHRTCFSPAVFFFRKVLCAVCLAGVLNDDKSVAASQFENAIHVSGLSVNMHRNHRCDGCLERPVKWSAGFAVHVAFLLEVFLKSGGIHA